LTYLVASCKTSGDPRERRIVVLWILFPVHRLRRIHYRSIYLSIATVLHQYNAHGFVLTVAIGTSPSHGVEIPGLHSQVDMLFACLTHMRTHILRQPSRKEGREALTPKKPGTFVALSPGPADSSADSGLLTT